MEKLKLITYLYDLIFEEDLPHDTKKLKMNLKFTGSEQEIKTACKNIANHIKFLEKENINKSDERYLDTAKKLKDIFGYTK